MSMTAVPTSSPTPAPSPVGSKGKSMLLRTVWLLLVLVVSVTGGFAVSRQMGEGGIASDPSTPRALPLTAKLNGRDSYTLYPGGGFTAGVRDGLLIVFNAPVAKLRGRTLSAEAYNDMTGEQVRIADGMVIGDEHRAGGKTRVAVSTFGIPYSGSWRVEVRLDKESFGQVVMNVPEHPWVLSPVFLAGDAQLRGTEGRIGITETLLRTGRRNRIMWHLWGSPEQLQGNVRVLAIPREGGRLYEAFRADRVNGPLNGSDASVPSFIVLPNPGMWRLTLLIDGMVFGSVVVDVK